MKKLFAALLSIAYLAAPLAVSAAETQQDNPYIFLLDAESLAGYSKVAGDADGDFSTTNRWLTSLGYKADPSTVLIGAYNGSYDRSQLFIRQEEGDRQSNKLMTNNASFAIKKNFTDSFVFRPVIFYNVIFVEETNDEDLGNGLYDYQDFGGGFKNTHTFGEGKEKQQFSYGFTAFERHYPNFESLLSAFDPNASLEKDEKDFVGYKGDVGWEMPLWMDIRGSLGYTLLYKDYTDKLTINQNGIRTGDQREDFYHEGTASLFKMIERWVGVGVISTLSWNDSNLDLYDTRSSASLADDRFFEDYYDYFAYTVSPSVRFYHDMDAEGKRRAELALTYTYEGLFYPDREALDETGNLIGDDQEDDAHIVGGRLTVPLTEQFSWVSVVQYKSQDSNQKFEQFYRYNYEIWSATTGISYQY